MMRKCNHRLTRIVIVVALACSGVGVAAAKPDKPAPEPRPEPLCETITIRSGPLVQLECAWTPVQEEGAETGMVTVDADGAIGYLAIAVRDSAPGDYCYLETWDRPTQTHVDAEFPLVRGDASYWDTSEKWCGTREDLNGEPLTVTVSARVKRDTTVKITLTPAPGR